MESIIALAGLVLAIVQGLYNVNFWVLLDEWVERPTKATLWKFFVFCALNVVLLNLIIILCRMCLHTYAGISFFPTYLNRTPTEWVMGAVAGSFVIFLAGCFLIYDRWLIAVGEFRPGLKEALRRWKWFYILDLAVALISYSYQVYWYGWWPW